MDNKTIEMTLLEIARILDLKGENPFKVRAYENGARAVEALAGDVALADDEWPQLNGELVIAVGQTILLGNGWELHARLDEVPGTAIGASRWEGWLDADQIPGPLMVRCARPGDRFQPLGMEGHSIKLSDFWINEKLPRRARAGWPLVVTGEEIAWIPGFRPAHGLRVRGETRNAVHLVIQKIPAA